ncbi:MAG: hypothetical protein MH252_06010 [Thermosynechococcaceae cyanobacterium MS004]|nr:hypothetical protein [Thermosynechococcaceae cyanobacterium MS004]
MWGSSSQQRHARDASRNIALTYLFAGGLGPFFWIGLLVFMGWLNGWFSPVGFSVQASKPALTPTDYKVRGEERIKNPFTWDEGVEDILTAIRLQKNKQYIGNGYSALATAYAIKGDKAKAVQYLKTAISFTRQYAAEATNDVERNGALAMAKFHEIYLQRCLQTDCRN